MYGEWMLPPLCMPLACPKMNYLQLDRAEYAAGRLSCNVAGNTNLSVSEVDLKETLELLAERLQLPTGAVSSSGSCTAHAVQLWGARTLCSFHMAHH